MSVCHTTRSLEEVRQQLLSDALDQIQRLQDPTLALNKRGLAEAAMAICKRDTAIRLLYGMATGTDDNSYHLKPSPAQPNTIQPNTTQPRAESATFHSGQE